MVLIPKIIPSSALCAAAIGALIVSGCTQNLKELEMADPQARTFASSLASEYLDYARSESEEGRRASSEYFAGKGLLAVKGKKVLPESVDAKKLLPSDQALLTRARQQLLTVLGDSSQSVLPQKAARAQLLFDCWLSKLETKASSDETTSCSTEFADTMNDLRASPGALLTPIPHYEVLFAAGSAEVDALGKKTIRNAAALARNLKSCQLHLIGHTDRTGHASVNQRLSERRVDAVKSLLESHKLCTKEIIVDAMGETSPKVRAPNGVAEAQNRRVDIEIRRGEP